MLRARCQAVSNITVNFKLGKFLSICALELLFATCVTSLMHNRLYNTVATILLLGILTGLMASFGYISCSFEHAPSLGWGYFPIRVPR